MNTIHIHHDLSIDGDPEAVFRLITEIEQWPALFPQVRDVTPRERNRWSVRVSWRLIPLTFTAAQRANPDIWSVEQRFGARAGIRIACFWSLGATDGGKTCLTLDAETVRGPRLLRGVVTRTVVEDFVRQSLEMIELLAESDRKAHQEIE